MEPVAVELDAPLEVANWRPLVQWLLAIPHWFIVSVLGAVSQLLVVISFFTILFTRKIPDGIYGFQAMYLRYSWRTMSYTLFMREAYPAFAFEMQTEDPGEDPAVLSLAEQDELNRWLPLVKWLLLVPHFVALVVLAIGGFFVAIAAFFAVLFTGRYPEGMRRYLIGFERWSARVNAYLYLLRDEYPPFSLT
jgi:roadblock/LC7 domain-containing protein